MAKKQVTKGYRVPVEVSSATAGTAVSPGWKIVFESNIPYFVPETKEEQNARV